MSDGAGSDDVPGYDEWVDSLADDGFYLKCANGHGSLPPRRVCPECGSRDLSETTLPEVGEIATFSEVHVATPAFAGETPYVTAVVDFGPVRITGVVRGADPDDLAVGTTVEADVDDVDDRRLVALRPR